MTTSQAVEMSTCGREKELQVVFRKIMGKPSQIFTIYKIHPWSKKKATTCVIQFVFLFIHPLSWGSRLDHLNRVTFSPSPLASQMGCQISCRHHLRSRWKKHPWQKIAWQKKSCLFLCVKLTVCTYKIGRPKRRFHLPTLFVSGRENAVFIPPQKGPFQKEKLVFQSRHFSEASC